MKPILALIFIMLIVYDTCIGQCVMCKAVGQESASQGGIGRGLNAGILFLMGIPYILLATGAWIIWKRFNKEEQ